MTIDEIVLNAEAETCISIAEQYSKMFLYNEVYMESSESGGEASASSSNPETNASVSSPDSIEVPKVDNVNAFKRFWNMIVRFFRTIRAKFAKQLSDKRLNKAESLINNYNGTQISIRGAAYNYLKNLTEDKGIKSKFQSLTELETFTITKNYTSYESYWRTRCERYKKFEIDDKSTSPNMIFRRNANKSEILSMFKKCRDLIDRGYEFVKSMDNIIKNNKSNNSEDVIKSGNFQHYVATITESSKYYLKFTNDMSKLLAQLIKEADLKNAGNNSSIDEFGNPLPAGSTERGGLTADMAREDFEKYAGNVQREVTKEIDKGRKEIDKGRKEIDKKRKEIDKKRKEAGEAIRKGLEPGGKIDTMRRTTEEAVRKGVATGIKAGHAIRTGLKTGREKLENLKERLGAGRERSENSGHHNDDSND